MKKTTACPDARRSKKRDGYAQMTKLQLIAALQARDDDRTTPQDVLLRQAENQRVQMELQNEQVSEAHTDLELSRHRYADLYDMAPVGYVTFDERGCIREINHTATDLLGYSTAHLVGKPLIAYLAQPDRKVLLQHLWQCRREEKETIITLRLIRKDGSERQVEFITRPAHDFESRPGWCRSAIVDVTDRRATEAALSASEAKFRLLAENMGEVFWFMYLDPPRATYVSPAFERIWGIPATEIYADNQAWMKAIHPDDFDAVRTAFFRWIEGESSTLRMEYRVLHRDGSIRWIADRGIIISRRDGRPHEISGIARDITERREAEAMRNRLAAVVESTSDAIFTVDLDNTIRTWNAGAEEVFGYTAAEMVGQTVPVLIPPEIREAENAMLERIRKMECFHHFETRRRRKDGRIIDISLSISPLLDSTGRMCGSSRIARDITERKQAEEAVQQSQRFAQSTLEAIPARLAVLDETGLIISTNHSWAEFAKCNGSLPHATGVGINYLSICDNAKGGGAEEAARFAAGIRTVLSGSASTFTMEYPCHSPEEQRWFVAYVTPFTGAGPRRVVVAHVDISQRKRAEQVIRRLNEELESRVELRTTQLTIANEQLQREIAARHRLEEEIIEVSEREQQRIGQDLHDDLGQQLAGTWMLSTVLERTLASQDAPEAPAANRISDLLKNALAMTRSLARGLHPVAPEPGGLMAALRDLTVRMTDMFRIDCRFDCAADVHVNDNTTATHLYRIAQEAVSNGVKHGRARSVRISLLSDAETTTLKVKDDGSGIGPVDSNHHGMGLRIMRYRADMIGGTIRIEKQKSGGTCVTCTFPTPQPPTSNEDPHGKETLRKEISSRKESARREKASARGR